jgi:hypothetical protein
MTPIEVAREEAWFFRRTVTDEEADGIIWTFTGFPAFWNIPTDGDTPEECFRKQLREYFADPQATAERLERDLAAACG